jgi:hypothetical protein
MLWSALAMFAMAVAAAVRFPRYRLVAVYLAAGCVAVPLFLGYDHLRRQVTEVFDPAVWSRQDDVLGSLAQPNQTLHWKRTIGFTEAFDITVTTNADGFRVTPPAPDAIKSVVFFGCSFTFGHGVEDHETYPYLVGEALGGEFATYNVSFNGWGPHESLAALQSGRVEAIVQAPPELVVFLTITDHVRRVIGREADPWRASAPRFVLEDGVAVRRGRFQDDPGRPRFSANDRGYWTSFSPEDFQLYGAVVEAMRDEVLQRFPEARFEVILWDTTAGNQVHQSVIEVLLSRGIEAHVSDEFLPGSPSRFMISKNERHPSPEGLRLLATFIQTRLLHGQ